jgi:thiol-disulfide isomerase/thioredoxin
MFKCHYIGVFSYLLVLFSILFANFGISVLASNKNFDIAIAKYKKGNYAEALSMFKGLSRTNADNIITHYYLALCYQSLNQLGKASEEYNYVYKYAKDKSLKASALYALGQISEYKKSNNRAASNVNDSSSANLKINRSIRQERIKVLEFYTNWCGVCHNYEPVFNNVKSKYLSKADFETYNAEDPSNSELVQRYQISRYPTTVFVNKTGAVLDRFEGGANEAGLIYKLNGALNKNNTF